MTNQQLADLAGIPLRILLAIRSVESSGNPRAVRFEPHLFHRDTSNIFTTSQVPWTRSRGPVSLVSSETNRAAFERAFRLDPVNAVTSTSWGPYQVLGGHLLSVRGPNPATAVVAFDANPLPVGEEMFVSWMRSGDRGRDARAAANVGDIEALAELYNGSQRWAAAVRRALATDLTPSFPLLPSSPLSTTLNTTLLSALAFAGIAAATYWFLEQRKK